MGGANGGKFVMKLLSARGNIWKVKKEYELKVEEGEGYQKVSGSHESIHPGIFGTWVEFCRTGKWQYFLEVGLKQCFLVFHLGRDTFI